LELINFMREKKILKADFGGLGDHLAFSTLAEVCDRNGYDFYLSDTCQFRNNQTLDLVWLQNPYFKGVTHEPANCGHGITDFENMDHNLSMNRNLEIKFGFPESILEHDSKFPIIYYQPKLIDKFKDSLLIDLNGHSFTINGYGYNWPLIEQYINEEINQSNYKSIYFIIPNESNYSNTDYNFNFIRAEHIVTSDIFNYTDTIYSCKKIITIWSGGSHLASAIKWKYNSDLEIVTFSDNISNKSCFCYDNVNYVTGHMINSSWS